MTEPSPLLLDGRPDRLCLADLPRVCDMPGCANTVSVNNNVVAGGEVLADDARDYVFCTGHAHQVVAANPAARPAVMPADNRSD